MLLMLSQLGAAAQCITLSQELEGEENCSRGASEVGVAVASGGVRLVRVVSVSGESLKPQESLAPSSSPGANWLGAKMA